MLQGLFGFEERLPFWIRPTYRGALFIVGLGTGRWGAGFVVVVVASVILLAGVDRGVPLLAGLFCVALVAGAVAGTVLGALRPLERWGRLGAWLRWSVGIFGYVAALTLLTPEGPFVLEDPTFHPLAAAASLLGAGILVLLDDRRPGRPTPRRYGRLQRRLRLWEAAARARARLRSRDGAEPPSRTAQTDAVHR